MRTFVAVEVNNMDVIDTVKKFQSELNISAKPVEAENLHFTLQFLGEVHENTLEKIKTLLSSIVFSPFNVKFIGVGTFPRPSKPRIIWIGTDGEGGNNLVHLAKQIEDVLEPIGFKPDKPFKPHITVFRVKKNPTNIIKQLEKFRNLEFGVQKVSEVKLKKSILAPEGPRYSDLLVVRGK